MLRVLFLHGLESRPNGGKVLALRAQGFEVIAPDMQMGTSQIRRKNSVIRMLMRLGEVRLFALVVITWVALSLSLRHPWWSLGGLALLVIGWRARYPHWVASALARSFETCVQIACDSVHDAEAAVLVGSSWGGAVAAELLTRGVWRGPTILLAPAIAAVYRKTQRADAAAHLSRLRELSATVPILIFHDPADETIPHADSESLAAGSSIELRSVSAGGHRLMQLLERGTLAAAIHSLTRL